MAGLLIAATLHAQPAPASGVVLPPPPVEAEWFTLPRPQHAWARHPVGAYRTLRVVTETFDDSGRFVARTETEQTDRLVGVTAENYTLQTTVKLQVGAARTPGQTEACSYRLLTDSATVVTSQVELEPAELSIEGRTIRCRRFRISTEAGQRTGTETVWYSPDVSPFVLRRDRSVAETPDSTPTEISETVTELQMPLLEDDGVLETHFVRSVSQRPNGRVDRVEMRGDRVPGGLVSASSVERDADGRRVRWSASEIVDFGSDGKSESAPRRWRLFHRRAE
ncbi:hypothetical protein Pla175_15380 [Pirellulimonas nuda]|uniref:Uncharacterized protein n=1 Tax=Pirellulimonas nuda TaxID=2528009 RepID=A0A518D9J6_9BACT|nr:hypothetical protein [Pirellulimonas nuda]QDU88167.1 hypothetical protein Pla175_15380 [Pirellulimonas nuda]